MAECSTITTNGFSSPRGDTFPAGLRVLVVDDDPTWLKILEKMLKKCSYEVTTCGLAVEALNLLRERKDGFDIVISDVNMPDMDGFKLLEHVGLEMELPVIMMSVDGETSRVMRGVQHGACDYLLKPIRMKELRNIWQHVYRKKIHEVRDTESHDGFEEIQMMRNGSDHSSDDGLYFLCGGDVTTGKKRKDAHDDKDFADPSSIKKARVVWTVDLHQKFVKAVNQIGFEKVGPKKILDLMNVPWLTRENVASHLQKYRLYLTRLQKENDIKPSPGGVKLLDLSSKEPAADVSVSPINMLQNDVSSKFRNPTTILVQKAIPRIHEGELNGIVSTQTAEPKKVVTGYAPESGRVSSSSRIGISPSSFGAMEPDMKYPSFDSTFATQFSWNTKVSELQFKQEHKPQQFQLENGFSNLQPVHSITHRPLSKERDKPANIESKPSYMVKSRENVFDPFSAQPQSLEPDLQPPGPITSSTWNLKDQATEQFSITDMDFSQKIKGSSFASFNGDLATYLFQGNNFSPTNLGAQSKAVSTDCSDPPPLIAEVSSYLYDALRFDYEYPPDSLEYPVIDQGLFIV